MKLNQDVVLSTVLGVLLAAACNGRLIVADGAGHTGPEDGGIATGGGSSVGGVGGRRSSALENGGESGLGGGSAGGSSAGGSSTGGSYPGGSGGIAEGGAAGDGNIGSGGQRTPVTCSASAGAAGLAAAGGQPQGSGSTCATDANGIAASDFAAVCTAYRCPASSAILLKGLTCDEPTTDHRGFTKTVGCGVETVEFNAEDGKAVYAATFDLSTQKLTALKVREDHPICFETCPCMAVGFQAGPAPSACPTAVTYRCDHATLSGPDEQAYAGCRDPGEAQCAQCCERGDNPEYCQQWSSRTSSLYDVEQYTQGLCPCGCEPCAHCKLEDERLARIAFQRTDCDCSTVVVPPTTGAGGSDPGGDPCIPYCSYQNTLKARCPGF